MVVRCTAKMLKLLGLRPSALPEIEPGVDDWYVNLLWFERRKCLLLCHASTSFSVFVPDVRKADVDPLGPLLVDAITTALDADGLPRDVLGMLEPANVRIAKTSSRRVLGIMNEVAVHIDYWVYDRGGLLDVDVISLNRHLQRTLHSSGRDYARPLDLARQRADSAG